MDDVDAFIFIPSREAVPNFPAAVTRGLNSVRRGFANMFRVTPLADDSCLRGIHRPEFLLYTWACGRCWELLGRRGGDT